MEGNEETAPRLSIMQVSGPVTMDGNRYESLQDYFLSKGSPPLPLSPSRQFWGPEYENASIFFKPFGGSTAVNALSFCKGEPETLTNVSLFSSYHAT